MQTWVVSLRSTTGYDVFDPYRDAILFWWRQRPEKNASQRYLTRAPNAQNFSLTLRVT